MNNEGTPVFSVSAPLDLNSATRLFHGLSGFVRAYDTTIEALYVRPALVSFCTDDRSYEAEFRLIEWKPCAKLNRGDVLHEGFLNRYISNDQHWQLIELARVCDVPGHLRLVSLITDIECKYVGNLGHRAGPFRQHLDRLRQIASLSKRLRPLMEQEPTMFLSLVTPEEHGGNAVAEAREKLSATLMRMETTARKLADNPDRLRSMRGDERLGPNKAGATRKSLERRLIWEPTFELWTALDRRVGYSEDGPILRFIGIIHDALGIPAPKPSAVRQAIDDFNGRARSKKGGK
jgi:hypothetical protein